MTFVRKPAHIFPAFSKMVDDFVGHDVMDWATSGFPLANLTMPAVNIKETETGYRVEVAAPGMKKEDFKIEIDNGLLTISSEKKVENTQKEGERFTRREFSYHSFRRSFAMPKDQIDEDKINAKYEEGILRVDVPKRSKTPGQSAKTVNID